MGRFSVFAGALSAAVLLAAGPVAPAAADGLRCNNRIVKVGDRQFEVLQHCGEPDIKVLLESAFTLEHGALPYREEWQYNFGPTKFMRFLRFRNSRLVSVRTGPHGFTAPDGRCKPSEITEGLSELELLARCGEPALVERRIAERGYKRGPAGPVFPAGTAVEDWIYDFGGNRFHRVVTMIDGRVVEIESERL